MEGTTAGALEAEVSAAIGATRHERCPDERSTHCNGYRQRLLTTQVGDLTYWEVSFWSGRRNGSWSAAASCRRPQWPKSHSRRSY